MELIHLFDKFKAVRAFVFDVDGVMTDNRILVTESGELLRTMNVRDGLALKMAVRAGYPVAVITGGRSEGVTKRLRKIGVEHIYVGISNKNAALNDFLTQTGLTVSEILYIGDDLIDLPVLKRAGIAVAPADAVPEVLEMADYISPLKGGDGCVRELIEKVLKLQGQWEATLQLVVQ